MSLEGSFDYLTATIRHLTAELKRYNDANDARSQQAVPLNEGWRSQPAGDPSTPPQTMSERELSLHRMTEEQRRRAAQDPRLGMCCVGTRYTVIDREHPDFGKHVLFSPYGWIAEDEEDEEDMGQ